jgi:hypothetical protein
MLKREPVDSAVDTNIRIVVFDTMFLSIVLMRAPLK